MGPLMIPLCNGQEGKRKQQMRLTRDAERKKENKDVVGGSRKSG